MSRRISVSNLAIQAIPLLQQAYTPDSLGGGFTPGYSLIEEMNPELSSSIGPGDILDY